ncbi:MAG: 1-phosphofructokinase family hexose kinase [Solobacterium sp.]|nr:1-phosphofructokinase family hexose kinase [Solobacterium sp.]
MIYTLTPNPAIDYYVSVENFRMNEINRAEDCQFVAAGKGINCSGLLDILGIESAAIYFAAGFTGKYISERLSYKKHIHVCPIETPGTTRINVKFLGENDTAINAGGPSISDAAKAELSALVEKLTAEDLFIISGSLPHNFTKQDVLELGKKINQKGARLVLDIPDLTKDDIQDLNVFLIKPNLEEFRHFLGEPVEENDIPKTVDRALGDNITHILISLGKHGSYYAGSQGRYFVNVPSVKAYSPVGAGDCTLAAFVGMLESGADIVTALKTANAAGSARVKYNRIEYRERIDSLVKEVEVIPQGL